MESLVEPESHVIMLMLTDGCNLNCKYCYERNKLGNVVDITAAKNLIDRKLSSNRSPDTPWIIEFFGGEPFLAFGILKELYNFVESNYPHIRKRYAFTTNGTLFNEANKNWLLAHSSSFRCTLSLDGTPSIHNLNRRTVTDQPTWDLIDLDFVKSTWPDVIVKLTVTNDTLSHLAESIIYLESLDLTCKVSLASGIHWDQNSMKVLFHQLSILCDHYISHPELQLCSLLDLPISNLYDADNVSDIRFCDAGLVKTCFDIHGNEYPCQGLTPLAAKEKAILQEKWNERLENETSGKCSSCPWKSICPTCYAANLLETGSLFDCPHPICIMHQLCMLCSSFIQFNRIESKIDSNTLSLEEEKLLYGVKKIQSEITIVPEIADLFDTV